MTSAASLAMVAVAELSWGKNAPPSPPPLPAAYTVVGALTDPITSSWLLGLIAAQVVLACLLSVLPTPLREKPGFAARNIVMLVPFSYAVYLGMNWFGPDSAGRAAAATYSTRLYGFSEAGWTLSRFMLGLQLYDTLTSLCVKDLRKAEHLGHHIFTAGAALAVLCDGPCFTWASPRSTILGASPPCERRAE